MAIVQVLDKSFIGEGLNAPKLTLIDPIESSGSLLLFDASKYTGGIADNTIIPNLFNENAMKITGTNSPMTLHVNQDVQGQSMIERSVKGGIHFIPNPTLDYGELDNYAALRGSGGVKSYMKQHAPVTSNPHEFYVSVWFRITSINQVDDNLINYGYETSHYVSNYCHSWNYNIESVYVKAVGGNLPVGYYHSYAVSDIDTGNPGKTAPEDWTLFNLFNFGPSGTNELGYQAKKYGASTIYRAYVEDLTISGRSQQEVLALDLELYNKAFTEGGKFYGDTWTNPTTPFTV